MEKNIAVIWGDCSSPEIVKQTLRVLDKVAEKYGHTFHYTAAAMGGEAIDKYGDPLPQHELDKCLAADSVLLGAVGGPKWEGLPGEQRPEKGLLRLRAGMGLYANNRPAKIWPQLAPASPLKPEIVAQGIDFIIVRELIGGVYFGQHQTHTLENGEKQAVDTMPYAEHEIERIGRIGFETARKRRKKLCCVDKANVLDTSRLWRTVMHRLQAEYPDVEYSEMFVDNCAMQIVKNPAQFDVIVTENMFGDILSDEASMITGSIGMIPSSSLGDGTRGLYEPIHGSAPDIAGQDIINPIACILSAAMMLRYSFDMAAEADCIEAAVNQVLNDGIRTADTDGHHAQSSGIRSVRVGAYHHSTGESVIFEHYLVNDSGARLPEADAVTRGYIAQKVVNFFVCFGCRSNVLLCSFVRLYQVVTVHGGGNSHFFFSCIHELKQCHLGSRVLHSDAVGTEIYVVFTPFVVFHIALIEQVGIQNLLG